MPKCGQGLYEQMVVAIRRETADILVQTDKAKVEAGLGRPPGESGMGPNPEIHASLIRIGLSGQDIREQARLRRHIARAVRDHLHGLSDRGDDHACFRRAFKAQGHADNVVAVIPGRTQDDFALRIMYGHRVRHDRHTFKPAQAGCSSQCVALAAPDRCGKRGRQANVWPMPEVRDENTAVFGRHLPSERRRATRARQEQLPPRGRRQFPAGVGGRRSYRRSAIPH